MTPRTSQQRTVGALLGRCLRPEGTRPYIQQMPRTWQMIQVGKRKIKLSNLEKVQCLEDGVLKAPCRGTETSGPTEGTMCPTNQNWTSPTDLNETRVVCPSAWMIHASQDINSG